VLHLTPDSLLEFTYVVPNQDTISVTGSAIKLKSGLWQNIALRLEATAVKLYINGTKAGEAARPAFVTSLASTAALYAGQPYGNAAFSGLMDELRIWTSAVPEEELVRGLVQPANEDLYPMAYYQFNALQGGALVNSMTSETTPLVNIDAGDALQPTGIRFLTTGYLTDISSGGFVVNNVGAEFYNGASYATPAMFTVGTAQFNPNSLPGGDGIKLTDRVFLFIPHRSGSQAFNLSFEAPGTVLITGNTLANYKLYQRPLFSDGAWTLVASAASSVTSNAVYFSNITAQGEFTVVNMASVTYDQFAGSAIRFDGVEEGINITHQAAMNTTSYTIELWFKTYDGSRAVQFLTGKGIENREIHLTGANRSIRFIPRNGMFYDTPANVVHDNVWTHLAAVYDVANARVRIYIDGKEVEVTGSGYNANNFVADNTGSPFQLGRRSDFSYHFLGEIDEFRLWKTARSQSDIWDNMRRTLPNEINLDLITYFQFNENTGYQVNDSFTQFQGGIYTFDVDNLWIPSTVPINANAVFAAELTGTQGWRFLASPVNTTVGGLMNGLWTQGFAGASTSNGASNVYTWSVAGTGNAATNWNAPASASQTLTAGTGALVYVYTNDQGPSGSAGSFPKNLSVTGTPVHTDQDLSARLNPNAGGWALLGNPFGTAIQWNGVEKTGTSNSVYIWDHNASSWKTWNGAVGSLSNGEIGAFNGFFVYTMAENPALSVPKTARSFSGTPFLGKTTAAPSFALKLTGNGLENKAWMVFDENSEEGFDANDAVKLTPYSGDYILVATALENKTLLDIDSRPFEQAMLEMPVAVKTTKAGTFSLSLSDLNLPEGWQVKLIDHEENRTVVLEDAYTFSTQRTVKARPTDEQPGAPEVAQAGSEHRFTLVISKTATAIEPGAGLPEAFVLNQNYPNPFNPATTIKFELPEASDVTLEVFDLTGRKVATLIQERRNAGYHQVNFNASRLASGMYIVRMQAAGKTFVKKMTLLK
jgi:hypothetical protein